MGNILKDDEAEKLVFPHQPKSFLVESTSVAKDFVKLQREVTNDFKIADIVASQAGIREIQEKNIEDKVESEVLRRLKDTQEQAYKHAYDLGLAEGTNKAFEEKRAEFENRLLRLDESLQAFDNLTKELLKANEATIVRLTFQVAEKIAMREIKADQAPIVDLVIKLIEEVHAAESVLIKMSLQDVQFVDELRQKNVKEVEPLQRVKLEGTDKIEQGGCVIETNFGAIDATIGERVTKAWGILESKLPKIDKSGA